MSTCKTSDYVQVLANCQFQLKMLEEADATIDQARNHFGRTENADSIKASIAIEKADFKTALDLLHGVQDKMPQEVQIQWFFGSLLCGASELGRRLSGGWTRA